MSTREEKMVKWKEALRSGDYAQTNERLYDGEAYCCLGVAAVEVFDRKFKLDADGNFFYGENNNGTLSRNDAKQLGLRKTLNFSEVIKINGIEKIVPVNEKTNREGVLCHLNDTAHMTFSEIADFIEEMGWDK